MKGLKNVLQDALRGILNSGGTIVNDWPIEQALTAGDQATGTTVLMDLYKEMGSAPKMTDLDVLWKQLGVARAADASVHFDDKAPLADIRAAITREMIAIGLCSNNIHVELFVCDVSL